MIYDRIRSIFRGWIDRRIEAVRLRNRALGSSLESPRIEPRTDRVA